MIIDGDVALADPDVVSIVDALTPYGNSHPHAKITAYRQNSASIRIIDPDFKKRDRALRQDQIWEILEVLPEDILSQISILLLLAPAETKKSIANTDFENPIPSRL